MVDCGPRRRADGRGVELRGQRRLRLAAALNPIPLVPAKAGTQSPRKKGLDARFRGHERKRLVLLNPPKFTAERTNESAATGVIMASEGAESRCDAGSPKIGG